MNRQIHVNVSGDEPIVIDLREGEAVTIHVDHNPFRADHDGPMSMLRIDGGRWTDTGKEKGTEKNYNYDILEWKERALSPADTVSIAFTESDRSATPPAKDQRFIAPEKECSFCGKKAREVKRLIEGQFFWALICDECINECKNLCDSSPAV